MCQWLLLKHEKSLVCNYYYRAETTWRNQFAVGSCAPIHGSKCISLMALFRSWTFFWQNGYCNSSFSIWLSSLKKSYLGEDINLARFLQNDLAIFCRQKYAC